MTQLHTDALIHICVWREREEERECVREREREMQSKIERLRVHVTHT